MREPVTTTSVLSAALPSWLSLAIEATPVGVAASCAEAANGIAMASATSAVPEINEILDVVMSVPPSVHNCHAIAVACSCDSQKS